MPPTAPCGVDSHLSRSVFHGAFSTGDGDAAHPLFQCYDHTHD